MKKRLCVFFAAVFFTVALIPSAALADSTPIALSTVTGSSLTDGVVYAISTEAELAKLTEEFNKKYTELATQSDTLPPTIKARRTQEVSELQQKISNFRESAYQDLQTQSETLIVPIKEKVRVAIKEVATEQGLIYVFEAPALLYYSDKSMDLTPLMKKKFNLQ